MTTAVMAACFGLSLISIGTIMLLLIVEVIPTVPSYFMSMIIEPAKVSIALGFIFLSMAGYLKVTEVQ